MAVNAAIAHGSENLPLGRADGAGSASSATGFSTIDTDMMAFDFMCRVRVGAPK
jgi:hypothetical protein